MMTSSMNFEHLWTFDVGYNGTVMVQADLDGDGRPESASQSTQGDCLVVWDSMGQERWMARIDADIELPYFYYPKVIVDPDGRRHWEFDERTVPESPVLSAQGWFPAPVVLDLDGDGALEMIAARQRLVVFDARTGKVKRQWLGPDGRLGGRQEIPHLRQVIGRITLIRGRGDEVRILVPTWPRGLFCLDLDLNVVWHRNLPISAHSCVSGDVDGDGYDETLWASTGTGNRDGTAVLWLFDWDGEIRFKHWTNDFMEDDHIDGALMLPPEGARPGRIVLSDGPVFDPTGKLIYNMHGPLGHGQKVKLIQRPEGDSIFIYADRDPKTPSGRVVATDWEGHILWTRDDLTAASGHRVSMVHPVDWDGQGAREIVVSEVGGWGPTAHVGEGTYHLYFLDADGQTLGTLAFHDSGYNRHGYPFSGGEPYFVDLDGDGMRELCILRYDGHMQAFKRC